MLDPQTDLKIRVIRSVLNDTNYIYRYTREKNKHIHRLFLRLPNSRHSLVLTRTEIDSFITAMLKASNKTREVFNQVKEEMEAEQERMMKEYRYVG